MSYNPKYTVTAQMLTNLGKIELIKQSFDSKPISPQLLHSLRETAKVNSVHYSTKIEGNQLTINEVANHIQKKNIPAKTHDENEVKAYYQAWNKVEQALLQHQEFSEDLIKSIHTAVEGSKKEVPYRTCQNAIYDSESGAKIYLPPEFTDVPELMKDLCDWVKHSQDLPVPIIAGVVHYQFVTIHPYLDGNGRTARLLTSFIMQSGGYGLKGIYSLEEYYAQNLMAYYDAIQTHPHHNYYYGRNEADITSWLEYFISGVAEAFSKVDQQATKQLQRGFEIDKSSVIRELDIKQRKILNLFVEFKQIESKQVAEVLQISSQSARAIIRKWCEEGFLQIANDAKKSRTYGLADKYESLLQTEN